MHFLNRVVAGALVFALAGFCAAQKFDTFEAAQKAAVTSNKPVLMVAYFACPGQTDALALISKALKADDSLAATAQKFQLACADLYDREAYPANNGFNPALEKKFGTPCTASLYAPGASKHLWRKQLTREVVMQDTTLSDAQIKAALDEAMKAWDDFQKPIADLEAQAKEDKKLKADPEFQLKLAEAWAKGFAVAKARDAYNEAIKLIRKEDKTDARIESLTLRISEFEFECEAWVDAEKSFGDFAAKFKDSAQANHARVMQYRAMAHGGNPEGAKAGLEKLLKDKKAADAKPEIDEALKEVEALTETSGKDGK
jgi:tetratricopeptide (TPR) repeat protein